VAWGSSPADLEQDISKRDRPAERSKDRDEKDEHGQRRKAVVCETTTPDPSRTLCPRLEMSIAINGDTFPEQNSTNAVMANARAASPGLKRRTKEAQHREQW
jgi:hypothetical protein